MEHIGVGSNKGRGLNNTEEERQQPVAVVDGCMVGLTMEEAQQSFFFTRPQIAIIARMVIQ